MINVIKIPNRINLFVLLTLIVFLTPFLMQITGNNLVKLIEDVSYAIMLIYTIYVLLLNNKLIIRKSISLFFLIIILVISTLIGFYYNGVYIVILQFREFKYLLLMLFLIPYSDVEYFKYIWTVIKLIAAISVPIAIVQWFIYKGEGDRISGLLGYGGSGTLTIFLLILFFSELSMRILKNMPIIGAYFLLLIPVAFNETKIIFILLPVMLFFNLLVTKKLTSIKSIIIIFVCILLFLGWSYIYEQLYSYSIIEVFSNEFLTDYLYSTDWIGDAGRFAKIIYAFDIIKESNLLFGYGLGASYSGVSSGTEGFIYNKYYSPEMFGGTRPQLFISLIDQGLFGTIIICSIFLVYFIKVMRIRENSFEKIMSLNCFIVLFISLPYQNIFYTYQIMYILVLYTCLVIKNNSENKELVVE